MMELYALHALNTNDSSNANCGKRNKMSKKDKEILSLMVFLIVLFQIVTVIYASKRVQSGKTTTKTADILVSILSPIWFWILKLMKVLSSPIAAATRV